MTISRDRVCASISEAAGKTPLHRLARIDKETPGVEIWAKLEFTNPGGSVKDRAGLQMLLDAEASGALQRGMNVIDSTSGNTGVALSLYGAARGYKVTLVMPSNVSLARKRIVSAFGAEIVYSDPMDGSDGAIRLVRQLVAEAPGKYFYVDQYSNPSNPRAHYLTTGPEILEEVGDELRAFVTGIGTSGTIMGTGRRLKEHDPSILVVGVEPDDSFHGLEGLKHIKTSIVPRIYDASALDETIYLPTEDGWAMTERLAKEEGLLVGQSSGASVEGALRIARRLAREKVKGVVVTILPDHASRYVEGKGP